MIHLKQMLECDFEEYLSWAIQDFAQDKINAGNWNVSEALEKSEASFQTYLPEGLNTMAHHFFSIFKDEQNVGMIWFAEDNSSQKTTAFIYDFVINETQRRKGFGKAALKAVEQELKTLGINTIGLHVFAHNKAARQLYEAVGYKLTNMTMAKQLD